MFALNSPPVQLSAVNSFTFLTKQASRSFLDNFWNFIIYKISVNVNKIADNIPAKMSSNIIPNVLFILSTLFIGKGLETSKNLKKRNETKHI